MSVPVLATKLNVAEEKVDAWERGEKPPTFKQAQNYAAKTHIPFGYLYLNSPPQETLPLPDLRTVGGNHPQRPSSELIEMVQIVLRRQQWYTDYQKDQGHDQNPHTGRFNVRSTVEEVVRDMRKALEVPPHPNRGSWEDYFRLLIHRIEDAGILVMREGFIGHHTRPLSVREFRGFAISDPTAPIIFVNQADTPSARLFTLIHELAHVWIGQSGISDASTDTQRREETLCNAIAAEFLVPETEFRACWADAEDWKENLPALEAHFHVSTWVIARRALTIGKINTAEYQRYVEGLQEQHRNRAKSSGGPNYYQSKKGQVSERFSRAIISETLSGRVLLRDAGQLLGMKPHSVTKYAKELGI